MSSQKSKKYGLIGRKLDHSFSKSYFEHHHPYRHQIRYENLEFESSEQLSNGFQKLKEQYQGLNVTIPYKEDVIPLLDEIDVHAKEINAVNCIKLIEGYAVGYNTDYLGFENSVKAHLNKEDKKALILGSGGASKAVEYAFLRLGITSEVVSRSSTEMGYKSLYEKGLSDYQIIVNTTPLGMYPDISLFPNIPYKTLAKNSLVIDLVYNPYKTIFLEKCQNQGARIMNGLRMLILQAKYAYNFWNQCE